MEENEKSEGFNFAVTFLATFGTIIYATYIYFQNNAVDAFQYAFASAIIVVLIILSILLIIYLSIKAFLMEVKDDDLKEDIQKLTSYIYKTSFLISMALLMIIIVVFSIITEIEGFITLTIISLIIFYILFMYYYLKRGKSRQYKDILVEFISGIFILIVLTLFLWSPLYDVVLRSPLQGHVTINMDSTYSKNITQIPVTIEVTGRNTESIIYLNNIYENKLTPIDKITLGPGHKDENIFGDKSILVGNAFDFGKYYIFINTSNPNMTVGYYELLYSRQIDGYKYGKSFYLLNASVK